MCRPLQIDRIPQYDGRRHQVEAAGPVALLLETAVADFSQAVEEHGARQCVASIATGLTCFIFRFLRRPQYGKDAPKHTAEFSAKMTELVLDRALHEQYNVSIEGTFRTAEVPMATLDKMREHGYQTAVHIQTAPTEVSWQSTLERYDDMLRVGEIPRYTDKAHHDLVVDSLADNADKVFASGKADSFKVYSREGLIFDDLIHPNNQPGTAIDTELYRNSRLLESLEKNFRESHHLLSDKQRLVVQESEKLINDLPPANQVQAKIYLYSGQLAQLQQSQPRPSEPSADVEIER